MSFICFFFLPNCLTYPKSFSEIIFLLIIYLFIFIILLFLLLLLLNLLFTSLNYV